jgi:pilus assembly protein CpaF
MSLLQRMERAQQAKRDAETPAAPQETPPTDQAAVAVDTAPVVETPAATADTETVSLVTVPGALPAVTVPAYPAGSQRLAAAIPVGTPDKPGKPAAIAHTGGLNAARARPREELLREVREVMQLEIVEAFKVLLDAEDGEVRATIEPLVDRAIARGNHAVTREERTRLVDEMVHDVTGFGPMEPLLADESITEIMVNGPDHIYIERRGKIERVDTVFLNDQHVLRVIERIITPLGRRIDESSPRVDARLPDGSRVNAIIAPLSLVGPVITVRKFSKTPYTVDDLIGFGTATPEMFEFLQACIEAKLNLFVSGGTGSGKTTTLNVLSSFIPQEERIVTIEDAAELQLHQDHVITLDARPPNLEGEGEITIRNLLRNALHMRPDRVIVGECRAGEALDMLQAMTTGHDGSLSTGHANSPKDMLRRLETMVLMTGYHEGKIEGALKPTGIRPTFMNQFQRAGIELPPDQYGIPPEDPVHPDRPLKTRFGARTSSAIELAAVPAGDGRVVVANGTAYVASIGPVDPDTGTFVGGTIREQTRRCMATLQIRLEAAGSSLANVVWANWSLRDPTDFDEFNDEWNRWFPGDPPLGQLTIMPPLQKRAGFGVSLGVIATV